MIKKFQIKSFNFSNAYLYIKENNEAILIDTASSGEKIVDYCRTNKIEIKYVLLTHNHLDHVMSLDKIIKEFNPIIYINQKDLNGLFDAKINGSFASNLNWKLNDKNNIISFDSDCCEEIELLGINIKIIPFGGHTIGSTFYLLNNKDIFIGDTIFLNKIGLHDKKIGTDIKRFIESINFIYDLSKKNNYLIYPGHYESGFKIDQINLNLNLELKKLLK